MNNQDLGLAIGIFIIFGTALIIVLRAWKGEKITIRRAIAYSIVFLFGLAVIYPNSSRIRDMIEALANFH